MSAEKAEKAKQKGNEEFAAKKYEASVQSFTEALTHDPKNHVLFSNRSAAYLKLKDYPKALADGEKCVQLNPDFGKGYIRQGQALHSMGEFARAVSIYAQGLARDPSNDTMSEGLAASQKSLSSAADDKKKKKKKGGKKKDDTQKAIDDYVNPDEPKEVGEDGEKPQEGEFDDVIGIDLGTTYSCVGVWQGDTVHIIENKDGERTIPSYVAFIPPEGEEDTNPNEYTRVTGMHAKNQLTRNPQNTVFDVKRIIGRSFSDQGVDADVRKFPYSVVKGPDNKPLIEIKSKDGAKKQTFHPEEISAMVLTTCKELAERHLGRPVKKAVITVPAYFNDAQRNATKAAGIIAGLDVLRIINEPTAAALSYGLDRSAAKAKEAIRVLIFDLGGGTFDVSILSIEAGIFTVLATGGDTRLGGEDFDNSVVEFLLAEIEKDPKGPKIDPRSDSRAIQRLRKAVEQAKRQLSASASANIVLDAFLTPKYNFRYTLSRQIFERLNKGYFTLCLDVVKRVLKDAKLKNNEIDEIVLVGGSTRIPKIQEMLQEAFNGKSLCKSVNPDEAVAYGAAVQGAILSGKRNARTKDLLLMDVTPLSLGIETTGRVMSVIIPRNTPIPCVKIQTYTTEQNYQTKVDVSVYEGERLKSDENNLLGEFTIAGIESAKRGEPQVDVQFAIDSNGILLVTAKDQKTGAQAKIEIANRSRASNEDIERMVEEAAKYKKLDEQRIQKIEAKNELETTIHQVLEVAEKLEKSDKKLCAILREAADKEQAWLDDGESENAKISEITKRRRDLFRRIQSKVDE